MAKALMGHLGSSPSNSSDLMIENSRLRARVRDLEQLVATLKTENDALVAAHTADLHESMLTEMLPA